MPVKAFMASGIAGLSAEVEQSLIGAAKNGDVSAGHKIIEAHLPMLLRLASQFEGRGVDFWDLVQIGGLALTGAIKGYDPSFDRRFSVYGKRFADGAMRTEIRGNNPLHYPDNILRLLPQFLVAYEQLLSDGQEPSATRLAGAAGTQTYQAAALLQRGGAPLRLSHPPAETDNDTTAGQELLADHLADQNATDPQEATERAELRAILEGMVNTLTPKLSEVMRLRYFGNNDAGMEFDEIARLLRVPYQTAYDRHSRACKILRVRLRAAAVAKEYLE